jgi:hypothetical protein
LDFERINPEGDESGRRIEVLREAGRQLRFSHLRAAMPTFCRICDKRLACVRVTPDSLDEERRILVRGKIDVESLILLEARPCTGESDAEIVAGAWDFERINRRYTRHLRILGGQPCGALGNDAAARALPRWEARHRASGSNNSSIGSLNSRAALKASGKLGSYFSVSIAFTV